MRKNRETRDFISEFFLRHRSEGILRSASTDHDDVSEICNGLIEQYQISLSWISIGRLRVDGG